MTLKSSIARGVSLAGLSLLAACGQPSAPQLYRVYSSPQATVILERVSDKADRALVHVFTYQAGGAPLVKHVADKTVYDCAKGQLRTEASQTYSQAGEVIATQTLETRNWETPSGGKGAGELKVMCDKAEAAKMRETRSLTEVAGALEKGGVSR